MFFCSVTGRWPNMDVKLFRFVRGWKSKNIFSTFLFLQIDYALFILSWVRHRAPPWLKIMHKLDIDQLPEQKFSRDQEKYDSRFSIPPTMLFQNIWRLSSVGFEIQRASCKTYFFNAGEFFHRLLQRCKKCSGQIVKKKHCNSFISYLEWLDLEKIKLDKFIPTIYLNLVKKLNNCSKRKQ